jgi:hypothetical protein
MIAHLSRRRLFLLVFVAIVILVLIPVLLAEPPHAPPPIGMWSGQSDAGRSITMIVTEDGDFTLTGATTEPLHGMWSWSPTHAGAGVLTCQDDYSRRHPLTAYHVTWRDGHRIEVLGVHVHAVLVEVF